MNFRELLRYLYVAAILCIASKLLLRLYLLATKFEVELEPMDCGSGCSLEVRRCYGVSRYPTKFDFPRARVRSDDCL